jgi:CarD family transcriptional regulator
LHRTDDQREQSYLERQLYEAALERLTREIAVVNGAEESAAGTEITDVLMSRVVPAAS